MHSPHLPILVSVRHRDLFPGMDVSQQPVENTVIILVGVTIWHIVCVVDVPCMTGEGIRGIDVMMLVAPYAYLEHVILILQLLVDGTRDSWTCVLPNECTGSCIYRRKQPFPMDG